MIEGNVLALNLCSLLLLRSPGQMGEEIRDSNLISQRCLLTRTKSCVVVNNT